MLGEAERPGVNGGKIVRAGLMIKKAFYMYKKLKRQNGGKIKNPEESKCTKRRAEYGRRRQNGARQGNGTPRNGGGVAARQAERMF